MTSDNGRIHALDDALVAVADLRTYHRNPRVGKPQVIAESLKPVLRRHVAGGHLRIPEYDATIGCRDGWAVFFAGYDLVHGVTPMQLTRPDGYRFSIVYYALKGMKDCFTAAVETRYARKRRTEREQSMAGRLAAGDTPENNLPAGCTGRSNRSMGGRVVQDGRDPRLSKKQSGRLVGGRSGPTLEPGEGR